MRPQADSEKEIDRVMAHAGRAIIHCIVVLGADPEDVQERLAGDVEWAADERAAREEADDAR